MAMAKSPRQMNLTSKNVISDSEDFLLDVLFGGGLNEKGICLCPGVEERPPSLGDSTDFLFLRAELSSFQTASRFESMFVFHSENGTTSG
jgi:hypothetical protein